MKSHGGVGQFEISRFPAAKKRTQIAAKGAQARWNNVDLRLSVASYV